MKRTILLLAVLALFPSISFCQVSDKYEVYALKYIDEGKFSAKDAIVGGSDKDSVDCGDMIWLLKGSNGKNILVDAGNIDSSKGLPKSYLRPDLVLQQIGVSPLDISDVILTHPHYDHIGGINLFPKAKIWMQEDDFNYFVGRAWQENGDSIGFQKNDVRNLIEINLQRRLKLIKGDNIEIFPGIRVFIGSKHTFENQYLMVNSNSLKKIIIASDAVWFYPNLKNLLPIPTTYCHDPKAYVNAMKRMKTLIQDQDLIIPGHDNLVFSKFPKVTDRIVRID
jgi:glyoxylase-like metal-dependent hydrolase (beta-lactamase superfamily II)